MSFNIVCVIIIWFAFDKMGRKKETESHCASATQIIDSNFFVFLHCFVRFAKDGKINTGDVINILKYSFLLRSAHTF